MEQRGHTDARLTLRVYAGAMCRSPQERDLRKALFDGLIGHQRALEPDSAAQTRLMAPRQSPPVAHSDLPTARSRAPTKTPSSRPQDRLARLLRCGNGGLERRQPTRC